MPPRIRFFFGTMSVVFFVLAAIPLFTELLRRDDIWWTPRTMLVPLVESANRVEIYARGRPLMSWIDGRQLQIVDQTGTSLVNSADVGLRFNNWERVRAERVPVLLVSAAACGIAALMFLLIVTGRLVYRDERPAA